jgi:hypothetical protein
MEDKSDTKRSQRGNKSSPWCLTCHVRMKKFSVGRYRCSSCGVTASKVKRSSRRKTPRRVYKRKPKVKLGAWCWVHQEPMQKHGINFICPGHWAVRIRGVGPAFAERSRRTTGRKRSAITRQSHPCCLRCRRRMARLKRTEQQSFRCTFCGDIAGSRCAPARFEMALRHSKVKEMILAGHSTRHIVTKLKVHHKTVDDMRKTLPTPALCECGKLKYHADRCTKRSTIRSVLYPERSEFTKALQSINAYLRGYPEEVRHDIAHEMFIDIRKAIKDIAKQAPEYLRRYNRWQNRHVDIGPDKLEQIAG